MQYLLHYLLSLKHWMNRHSWERTPVAAAAWALLRDSYHGPLCLQHPPQHIAVTVLYLALQCYGVEVPADVDAERPWWQVRETGWEVNGSKVFCVLQLLIGSSFGACLCGILFIWLFAYLFSILAPQPPHFTLKCG